MRGARSGSPRGGRAVVAPLAEGIVSSAEGMTHKNADKRSIQSWPMTNGSTQARDKKMAL